MLKLTKGGIIMDFSKIINRQQTNSIKWDGANQYYQNETILPMWIADMDFQSPQAIQKAVKKQAEIGVYGYPLPAELTKAPQAVSDWLKANSQWEVDVKNIHFTPGLITGITTAINALTNYNDAIITQVPLYGHFEMAVNQTKRQLIVNPLKMIDGRYQLDLADFEQKIIKHQVKLFILCNPHNPTGRVWQVDELKALLTICQAHHVIVLSDEIHSDLIMPDFHHTPSALALPSYQEQIITFKSPSKTFNMAGLQIAYFITNNSDFETKMLAKLNEQGIPGLQNSFATPALIAAYQDGKPWLDEVIAYIATNYDYLKTTLNKSLPSVYISPLEATYLVWLKLPNISLTEEALKTKLDQAGIGVQTTSDFGLQEGLYIRINIATAKENVIIGVNRLIDALKGSL